MPERTCVGCRRRRPSAELRRIVLASDGHALVSRVAPGRGAWVCARADGVDADCVAVALRRRGFERAWRRPLPAAAVDELRHLGPLRGPDRRDDDEQDLPDCRQDARAGNGKQGGEGVRDVEPAHRKG